MTVMTITTGGRYQYNHAGAASQFAPRKVCYTMRMPRATLAMAAGAITSLALAAPARAEPWVFNAVGAALGSWTDNILNVRDPDPLGGPGAEADLYTELRPGVLAVYETPRSVHNLSYTLTYTAYATHSEANSLQHQVSHAGVFHVSPTSDLTLGADFALGQTNQLASGRPGTVGQTGIVPSGSQDFVRAGATQGLSWQPSPDWRCTQLASVQLLFAEANTDADIDPESRGLNLSLAGAAERGWRDDSLSLQLGASHVRLSSTLEGAGNDRESTQLDLSVGAGWTHDLGRELSVQLRGGVTRIMSVDGDFDPSLRPTAGADLAWSPNWARWVASYSRSTQADLFIARNTETDAASLSGWTSLLELNPFWVFDESFVSLTGSVGYQRVRLIDLEVDDNNESASSRVANAALAWQGAQALALTVSYSYTDRDTPPETMTTALLPFQRNTVTISLSGRWPTQRGAYIPGERDPLRVRVDEPVSEEDQRRGPAGPSPQAP
jgi:hypothetical protein